MFVYSDNVIPASVHAKIYSFLEAYIWEVVIVVLIELSAEDIWMLCYGECDT